MQPARHQSPSDADIGYVLLRQVGGLFDELSAQGLALWMDEQNGWWWRWRGTDLASTRRLWALGEALVDALIARYPAAFGGQWPVSDVGDWEAGA